MATDTHYMPRYTDGSLVSAGDSIRFHQAAGGMFAPGDWRYGVAVPYEHPFGGPSLLLEAPSGLKYNLFSHVIERASK